MTYTVVVTRPCLLHLIRNTFRYAARRDWDALGKQLRPIYTAPAAAADRFAEFTERRGGHLGVANLSTDRRKRSRYL